MKIAQPVIWGQRSRPFAHYFAGLQTLLEAIPADELYDFLGGQRSSEDLPSGKIPDEAVAMAEVHVSARGERVDTVTVEVGNQSFSCH